VKIILDSCVWGKSLKILQDAGHDVVWAGDWPEDPGDDEILAYAQREQRILVTLDKDFGTLAVIQGRPHAGIIRLVNISAQQQASTCLHILALHKKQLEMGAIITAQPGKLRIRLPLRLH
jgi:predicted nuclease of predicted toxin-antitoxin system